LEAQLFQAADKNAREYGRYVGSEAAEEDMNRLKKNSHVWWLNWSHSFGRVRSRQIKFAKTLNF